MFKEPYELSVWEDIIVPASGEIPEHFDEKRIAIIGSHEMDIPTRAYNVALKEGINGELTLTFDMSYKYYDEETGDLKDNPFFGLLSNERKLKFRIGEAYSFTTLSELEEEDVEEKWKDFVIKNSEKNSQNYSLTFTAKELFVNELGKNGWSVVLDTELENNFGTIEQLGESILEGSDWSISSSSYSPTEKIEEPLFKVELTSNLTAINVLTGDSTLIASGQYIYPFYNCVEWDENSSSWIFKSGEIQFLWANKELSVEDADDDRVIIDYDFNYNYTFTGTISSTAILLTGTSGLEPLKGNRIVKSQKTRYEAIQDKYVKEYVVNNSNSGASVGTQAFGYTETEYITSEIATNLLTNSNNFTSILAWDGVGADTRLFPVPTGNPDTWEDKIFNYLSLDFSEANKQYYNEGPDNINLALVKDNVYVLRMKARWIKKNETTGVANISASNLATLSASIRKDGSSSNLTSVRNITTTWIDSSTDIEKKGYASADTGARTPYSAGATSIYRDSEQYIYVYLVANTTTKARTDELKLFITNNSNIVAGYDFCIEDIQLFEYKEDADGVPVFVGDIPNATIKTKDKFYHIVNGEVDYLSSNTIYYTPQYEDNFQSIRNISVKESNYFNNIQSLAELFEVWVKFKTYHRKNGKILLTDGLPQKEVIFSRFAPNGDAINQAGFKYGVNLQSIKRTVDSDNVATKVIVKNNNQEYAVDGTASISRAHANPSGENELYNFNYYINQELLDYSQVLADLYGMTSTDLAFLTKLKKYNNEYSELSSLLMAYENEIFLTEANITLYETQIASANEELLYLSSLMASYNVNDQHYKDAAAAAALLTAKKQNYTSALIANQNKLTEYETKRDAAQTSIDTILANKKTLKLKFYRKYYRFIQEGTWTDDTYTDDDLYYLDAAKVASVSAFPKVSYTISVLDVENVDGYEAYKFKIGERTYIEDPEFFGYILKNVVGIGGNIKTPYRQSVVISERTRNFDDPSKSSITVQNYKNQFEELFQKITATTQSLQYESGAYGRAAAAVSPTGEIDITTLEKSFANNSFILSNSQNQNVIWDSGVGIEIINNENSNERMRLVAGGMFLSNDGGKTWRSGITGLGINTRYLLAGQIDVSKINLVQGTTPYFRWDTDGISAFYVDEIAGSYDMTKYVRFNQYGLFGTTQGADLQTAVDAASTFDDKVAAVKQYSNFSITWDGLALIYQDGAVSVSADDGLEIFGSVSDVFSTETISALNPVDPSQTPYVAGDRIPLVSLGRFYNLASDVNPHFGLRMRDRGGYVTLSTDINGEFWVQKKFYVGQKDDILAIEDEAPKVVGFIGDTVTPTEYTNVILPILEELGIATELPTDPNQLQQFYQEHSIRLWGGTSTSEIYSAPFFVLEDGTLYAQNALFEGVIHARGGSFDGLLTIGANDKNGIDGTLNADIVLWAGKVVDGEDISYNFSVDKDGLLFAKNANIQGNISVESGNLKEILIPDWHSGITSQGEVLLWINATVEDDTSSAAFYITQAGSVYTSKLYLRDGLFINPSIDNSYYQIGFNQAQLAMWAGATNIDYNGLIDANNAASFRVTYNGEVYASYINLDSGSLIANNALLTGKLSLQQISDTHSIILDSEKGIYTSNFNTSQGWQISKNGDAVFNNVNIRGELTSATFTYQSKNIMGGDLLLSPTYYHPNSNVDFTYNAQNGNMLFILKLSVNDNIYMQSFWPEESTEENPINGHIQVNLTVNVTESTTKRITLEGIDGTVARIGNNTLKINLSFNIDLLAIIDPETVLIELLPGISIASLGECGITLNASHPYGPAIVITDLAASETVITQLGRLEGVIDSFFNELHGYGLYAQNAYLTGKLFLPNAGITDSNDVLKNGQPIRIWAGASPEDKANAPFIVTQDGSVYASKGVFSGTVNATDSTFSGYLQTAGILIGEEGEDFDSFYVAYDNRNESDFPRVQDLILKINHTGLNIWEGGLRAFSDYASGWRDGILPITPTINPIYGYNGSLTGTNPFPYFSLIDDANMRLYLSNLHIGRFELSENSLLSKSVKISNGEITFIQRTSTNNDFLTVESNIYNTTTNIWKIGLSESALSINSDKAINKFTISNGSSGNLIFGLSGLLDIIGNMQVSNNIGIGEHTIIKPYESSEGENHNGIDFMI